MHVQIPFLSAIGTSRFIGSRLGTDMGGEKKFGTEILPVSSEDSGLGDSDRDCVGIID